MRVRVRLPRLPQLCLFEGPHDAAFHGLVGAAALFREDVEADLPELGHRDGLAYSISAQGLQIVLALTSLLLYPILAAGDRDGDCRPASCLGYRGQFAILLFW